MREAPDTSKAHDPQRPAASPRPPALGLFGAAPDTGNLGVSALCHASVAALTQRIDGTRWTIFDHGDGHARRTLPTRAGPVEYERCGARLTRRLHRAEALGHIRLAARLGGLGNAAARRILASDAILDLSGGDSFTDLYGGWRFRAVTLPKLIALDNAIPLVLLPQTCGPFETTRARRTAERIVREAALCWARDQRSFSVLRELLGDAFDAERHRCGVDVAFLLESTEPAGGPELTRRADDRPLVGFNVSGLIHNDPDGARERFGIVADYRKAVVEFLRSILRADEARILLVPHVATPPGHYESDLAACRAVAEALDDERVAVCPGHDDPCGVKWVISQCDWFCGTRMHATIAALSSGVPCAAIAYSPKTRGVFESVGQGEHVVDPRAAGTAEVIERLRHAWRNRDAARSSLERHLPATLRIAQEQMDVTARYLVSRCVSRD